jgi:hypothetical protein
VTRKQRSEKGDPRPSIKERYPSKGDYVKQVKAAVHELRMQRFLLEEDERKMVKLAEDLAWPPKPMDGPPFWEMEKK